MSFAGRDGPTSNTSDQLKEIGMSHIGYSLGLAPRDDLLREAAEHRQAKGQASRTRSRRIGALLAGRVGIGRPSQIKHSLLGGA
jgi:hypothetical protein